MGGPQRRAISTATVRLPRHTACQWPPTIGQPSLWQTAGESRGLKVSALSDAEAPVVTGEADAPLTAQADDLVDRYLGRAERADKEALVSEAQWLAEQAIARLALPRALGRAPVVLPGRRRPARQQKGIAAQIPPMQTYLISQYSSMPYFEPSRPIPDSLTPPNGATSVEMIPSLTPTMPYSSASATRQIRPISRA